ncbi:hypothetical protein IAU60_006635 [Kwoniella sp. DSM 27419]
MTEPIRFDRYKRDFWTDIDEHDTLGDLDESSEEVALFSEQVQNSVEAKFEGRTDNVAVSTESAPLTTANLEGDIFVATAEEHHEPARTITPHEPMMTGTPIHGVSTNQPPASMPPPSFHHSQVLQTSTPRAFTSTFPSITTPSEAGTPKLRAPLTTSDGSQPHGPDSRLYKPDTPDYVASPVDTPPADHQRPRINGDISEGRGRRDDPATPVLIGKSALTDLKSRKDHQAITKHFDLLARSLTGNVGSVSLKGKGRPVARAATVASTVGLGGRVFDSLRFCLTSEVNQAAKLKQRADIIANLGGQVVLQPDTAITHVIYDQGRSASLLAQKLGLETLSELPEGTVCVKWDWVVQCKMVGKLLDPAPWLSFPITSFSRAVSVNAIRPNSRMFDITDQLRGRSMAITRKREPTASDSDTEESLRKKNRLAQTRSVTLFPPVIEKPEPDIQVGSSGHQGERGEREGTVATEHQLPSGPGWSKAKRGERDALDIMIEGVIDGSVSDPEAGGSDEEEAGEAGAEPKSKVSATTKPLAGGFKCGQPNDGKGYTGPNEWLAKKFEELHDLYQGQVGKNAFAIRGYQRAAGIMRRIAYPIVTGAQARAIPGIGSSLADRIDEFLTGAQGRAYYENTEQARCVALFKDIYGVGRQHANDLYRQGARSIQDLRSGQYNLTTGQMIGLDLYDDLKSRIPRDECREIYQVIHDEAKAIDDKLWIEIMGSYRRGQETSGDVDILITREGGEEGKAGILGKLVSALRRCGLITHDLSAPSDWTAPEAKWMGVGRLSASHKHRRIDILCIPYEYWGAALIYFTGNEVFNRSMRLYARKLGYSLNQRGLYRGVIRGRDGLKQTEGELVASRTEQEIFDMLGLRWRHPHHRRP